MRNKDNYVHGSHNVICDRSGFKVHVEDTWPEWNGLRVRKEDWEPRHPQDLLRSVPDDQSVEDPRPGATDTHSQTETTLDADELAGQTVLSVASTSNMTVGDTIIVFMDNDGTHVSTIASFVADDTVTINGTGLPFKAASGKQVVIISSPTLEASL